MLQNQKPRNRFDNAQRGVLLGLRLVHSDIRARDGNGDRQVLAARPVRKKARRARFALHGIYEQRRKTGAEGGFFGRGHLCRPLHIHSQKRHLQGNTRGKRRRTWRQYSGSGRHFLKRRRAPRIRARDGQKRNTPRHSGAYGRVRRRTICKGDERGLVHDHRRKRACRLFL